MCERFGLVFLLTLLVAALRAQVPDASAAAARESYRAGDCTAALPALIAASKTSERLVLAVSRCLITLGKPEDAVPRLTDFLGTHAGDVQASILLAKAWAINNQATKSVTLLEPLVAKNSSNLALKNALASAYLRAQRVADAKALLTAIAAEFPEDPDGLKSLGDLAFAEGDFRAAVGYYEKTLAVDPADFEALLQTATAHLRLNATAAAVPYLERASRLRPTDWQLNRLLADSYRKTSKWSELIASLDDTSLQHADDEEITTWMVEAFRAAGKQAAHEAWLRAMLQHSPANLKARLTLAEMLYDGKRLPDAAAEYKLALKVKPDMPDVSDRLGQMAENAGQLKEALEFYAAACRSSSATPDMRMRLARAYFAAGDMAGARLALEQVLKYEPKRREAKVILLQVALKTQQTEEATRWAADLLPEDQNNPELLRIMAESALRKNQERDAAGYFEKILAVRQTDRALRFQLVGVYNGLGTPEDLERVRSLMEEYTTSTPDDPEGHLVLANVLRRAGNLEGARASFERGFQRMPTQPPASLSWAYNSYGLLLSEEQRFEDASIFLAKATELNPKDEQATYNLALIYLKLKRKEEVTAARERLLQMGSTLLTGLDEQIEKSKVPERRPGRKN